MKHIDYPSVVSKERITHSRPLYEPSNLSYLLSVARRRKILLLAGLIAGFAGGAIYYIAAHPKYTATTYIYIDSPFSDGRPGASNTSSSVADSAEVDSQVEVIRSWQVVEKMTESLSPADRARLAQAFGPHSPLPAWVSSLFDLRENDKIENGFDLKKLSQALTVNRVERTYVLGIGFTAPDPTLAADIANTFVAAYQKVLEDRRLAAERTQNDWLKRRVDEVHSLLLQADRDLQSFRLSSVVGDSDAARRELELKTQNYRSLYQSLLQQQGVSGGSISQSTFHTITYAEPSATQRTPRPSLVAMLSLIFGLGAGSVAAAIREASDQSLRTRGQVETFLGARFLGWLPMIPRRKTRRIEEGSGSETIGVSFPDALRFSTDCPRSRYAETLREIVACASLLPLGNEAKVIGIVSALPEEGRSTLAINLGRMLADQGARALVIDGDLRKRGLTQILEQSSLCRLCGSPGEGDDRNGLDDLLMVDKTTGMLFLPAADANREARRSAGQIGLKFRALLVEAKKRSDFVIIDLPPLAAVAEARLLSAPCDCFVLVSEWGRTNRVAVQKFLESEPIIRERLLGVVLNKVDLGRLRQYEQADEPQHHPFRNYFSDSEAKQ